MSDAPTARLLDHFAALDDPRVERTKRHALLDIVTIAVCAIICGADSWVEVAAFGTAKRDWLASFLALPNGIPSHDTFGRVFAALDPAQLRSLAAKFAARLDAAVSPDDLKSTAANAIIFNTYTM